MRVNTPQNWVSDEPQRGLYTTYLGGYSQGPQWLLCSAHHLLSGSCLPEGMRESSERENGDGGCNGRLYRDKVGSIFEDQ